MIRQVTRVKSTSKATTMTAPQRSASKSSKAHSADVEGDSRHPSISLVHICYLLMTFLLENALPVRNSHLTRGKGGHAAHSADVEGDGRHPTILFRYVTY